MSIDNVTALGAFLVSLVAAWFSWFSWRTSHATERRMLEIEEGRDAVAAKESARARLTAKLHQPGRGRHAMLVANEGQGEARNIRVFLDGRLHAEHEAYDDAEALSELSAGGKFSIRLSSDLDTALPRSVLVEWEDDSGDAGRYSSGL